LLHLVGWFIGIRILFHFSKFITCTVHLLLMFIITNKFELISHKFISQQRTIYTATCFDIFVSSSESLYLRLAKLHKFFFPNCSCWNFFYRTTYHFSWVFDFRRFEKVWSWNVWKRIPNATVPRSPKPNHCENLDICILLTRFALEPLSPYVSFEHKTTLRFALEPLSSYVSFEHKTTLRFALEPVSPYV